MSSLTDELLAAPPLVAIYGNTKATRGPMAAAKGRKGICEIPLRRRKMAKQPQRAGTALARSQSGNRGSNPRSGIARKPRKCVSWEEVLVLGRAAASKQDGTIFLLPYSPAYASGELLGLRWCDADFTNSAIHVRQSFTNGRVDTPKSGQERTVPMAEEVAEALAALSQRDEFRADDDLVFCGVKGGHLSGHKRRNGYKAALEKAGLRDLFSTTSARPSVPTPSALPTPER